MSDSFVISMDCNPPSSSVHGVSQARILGGLPLPSPGHLPDSGTELTSPALAGGFFTTEPPEKPKHHLPMVLKVLSDEGPFILVYLLKGSIFSKSSDSFEGVHINL